MRVWNFVYHLLQQQLSQNLQFQTDSKLRQLPLPLFLQVTNLSTERRIPKSDSVKSVSLKRIRFIQVVTYIKRIRDKLQRWALGSQNYLCVKLSYGNLSQLSIPYIYFLNLPIFYFEKLQGSFGYKSIHSTMWWHQVLVSR